MTYPAAFRFRRHRLAAPLAALCALLLAVPGRGETLRMAIAALPASLGNPFTSVGQPSTLTWSALFDGLTRLGADGAVEPALATSWAVVNPRVWRFTLRENTQFSDGTPVTASAVAASLELLRAPAGRKLYVATEVQNIVALRAIDAGTLEIETRRPDAILPRRLAILPIVSAAAWQAEGEAGFAQAPVGTGPYRVIDWGSRTGVAHFAAADSWRKPVAMDRLELVPLENPLNRLQALLSGQVDVAARINAEDVADAKAAGFNVANLPAPQVMSLTFKVAGATTSPIADVRVRRALALAINRDAMAAQILLGTVVPAGQPVTRETAGFDPSLPPPAYDPARAKALLAEAGFPKGFTLAADVMVGTSPADDLIYQRTVQDLAAVGVAVTLRAVPYPTWLHRYTSGAWGSADAFSLVWDSSSFYDAIRVLGNASCRKPGPFFCDPSLMPLYDAVDAEMDDGRRMVALRQLEAAVVERVPALFLVSVSHHYALSPRLADVSLRNSGLAYETIRVRP